ncbi:MAG: hypothetical protein ABSA65_09090 [Acidimicrobiales bacterium]
MAPAIAVGWHLRPEPCAPGALSVEFHNAIIISAAVCVVGGVVAAIGVCNSGDLGPQRSESSRHPRAQNALDEPPLGEET